MSYRLLVWEMVPEDTEMYLIPEEVFMKDARYESFMKHAHNCYINGKGWEDDEGNLNEGLRFLNNALGDEEMEDDGFEQYRALLRQYKVDMTSPIESKFITTVYHSGFIL